MLFSEHLFYPCLILVHHWHSISPSACRIFRGEAITKDNSHASMWSSHMISSRASLPWRPDGSLFIFLKCFQLTFSSIAFEISIWIPCPSFGPSVCHDFLKRQGSYTSNAHTGGLVFLCQPKHSDQRIPVVLFNFYLHFIWGFMCV